MSRALSPHTGGVMAEQLCPSPGHVSTRGSDHGSRPCLETSWVFVICHFKHQQPVAGLGPNSGSHGDLRGRAGDTASQCRQGDTKAHTDAGFAEAGSTQEIPHLAPGFRLAQPQPLPSSRE